MADKSKDKGKKAEAGESALRPDILKSIEDDPFEIQQRRLEEIAQLLEGTDLNLDDSLMLYEEAVRRVRKCQDVLGGAELRIEWLNKNLAAPEE
ncbi:MAG: exodeoxyribonuclease VII small subunit [Planctomycetes bacterium]|nr:exodeoxyribonuclease VII small subunit [Planctomycetota bacterium]